MHENEIGKMIVDAAVKLHKKLGPGLLESVYEVLLAYELNKLGLKTVRQFPVKIKYDHIVFDEAFRADIIVNEKVLIEIKSVEKLNNAHKKQLLTYLKLTNLKLGYLINFSEALLKDGITRTVNQL